MNQQLKINILDLLKKMKENKLLDGVLYEELHYWLSQKNNDEFQQNHPTITRSYDILTKYHEHCVKTLSKNELNLEELTKRSKMLVELLQSYRNKTDYYSAHAVLIKLELILFNVIDKTLVSNEKTTPEFILTNIYSTKEAGQQFQQPMMKKDDEEVDNDNDERLYLVNELMDAPLDDIIEFMRNNGRSFEQFYTHEFYDEMLDRLENLTPNSVYSNNIIDKLCGFITDKKFRKKYGLERMDFVSLLGDQFHIITSNKYRIYLEKFVKNNMNDNFTLENFYSFHKIPSVLSSEENQKFQKLFNIYCKKLVGGSKPQQACRSPRISTSLGCRIESENVNPWHQEHRIGRNIDEQIRPLQYNLDRPVSNVNSSQTANQLQQQSVTNHQRPKHYKNRSYRNSNQRSCGQQMFRTYKNDFEKGFRQQEKSIK